MLQDTQDWLAAHGIRYVFVLTPDKHQIYPEYIPASIHRLHEQTRSDQLIEYCAPIRRSTCLICVRR